MDARQRLADNLVSETEAYGYTLSVWGAGAMLIDTFDVPDAFAVFLFVGGALTSYAVLAGVAFGQPLTQVETSDEEQLTAASIVHVVATLGNLAVSHLLVQALAALAAGTWVAAFAVGFQVSLSYNLLLLLERGVTELLR